MKNKYLYYLIFGIITYFSLFLTVFASEQEVTIDLNLYENMSSVIPFTDSSYNQFQDYFNHQIELNGDSEKTYLVFLFYTGSQYYFYLSETALEDSTTFGFYNQFFQFYEYLDGKYRRFYSFSFSNENNDIKFNNLTYSTSLSFYPNNAFRNSNSYGLCGLVWSNKPIKYKGEIDTSKTYYRYNFKTVSEELKKYYDFSGFGYNDPIYTYSNLLFGDYEVKEPVTVAYKVEYYFDDILDSGKTEYKTGLSGSEITEYTNYATEMYKLVEGTYSIILNEDESLNVLKIYYRSPLYGTEKSPVETKNQRVWFFFQFSDLKTIFPNVEFGNFTQYQQLVITILVNIFFCLFLLFISYITLKAVFKCWSWIMGFIT